MEPANIFYGETAAPAPASTPTQAPQPAGLAGSTGGGLSAYTSSTHQALYLVLLIVGGAFLLIHLT